MNHDANAAPLNPLPWIVWAFALPIIAMEVVLSLGEAGIAGGERGLAWRIEALTRFSFVPDYLRQAFARGEWMPMEPWRLLTQIFVHGSLTSSVFAVVILLALGKMVGEIFRWWAVAAVFLSAAVAGALVYTLALPGNQMPLFGAFPADYGLIGAFTFLIWVRLAGTGTSQFRAFTLIGFLLGTQLLFGLVFGTNYTWVAELAGFAAGFLISFVVSPGGWRRVMARLRMR